MNSAFKSALLSLATIALLGNAAPSAAADNDSAFFRSVEGAWSGPGEIIAGKYKGTKFVCNFSGSTPAGKLGITLDGGCRVGVFMQKMTATVEHDGVSGYKGTFLDGAAGTGLDIVSGNVAQRKVVLGIHRNELKGTMQARLPDDQTMTVTVSVRVEKTLVPVIGVNLKRVDDQAVGSIAKK